MHLSTRLAGVLACQSGSRKSAGETAVERNTPSSGMPSGKWGSRADGDRAIGFSKGLRWTQRHRLRCRQGRSRQPASRWQSRGAGAGPSRALERALRGKGSRSIDKASSGFVSAFAGHAARVEGSTSSKRASAAGPGGVRGSAAPPSVQAPWGPAVRRSRPSVVKQMRLQVLPHLEPMRRGCSYARSDRRQKSVRRIAYLAGGAPQMC